MLPRAGASNRLTPFARRAARFGLLIWALSTCFARLGSAPVYIVNEAREGVYVRAMLDSGDFVLPRVPNHVENGEIFPDKPPLFHWIAALATAARGLLTSGRIQCGAELSRAFDAWMLRFPSALCAVLSVAAVAILGARLVGERAALLAAATLLASWGFVQQSRYGRVDMVLTCGVTTALLLAGHALVNGSRLALVAAGAAAGAAILAKGPLGIVLPGLSCAAWVLVRGSRERSSRRLAPVPLVVALFACAAVALPWYVLAYRSGGEAFLDSQIVNENLHQASGVNGRMGFFYYCAPWLLGSFPWNLFALAGCVRAWRTRAHGACFCALGWASILAFFQLAAYKRGAYLLPAMPVGAMLAGHWLDAHLPRSASTELAEVWARLRARLPAWWPICAAAVTVAASMGTALHRFSPLDGKLGAQIGVLDRAFGLGGALAALAGLALLIEAARRRDGWLALLALGAGQAGAIVVLETAVIVAARRESPEPLAARILADLPAGERVIARGLGDDPSLPLLLAFPDPARVEIVAAREPRPSAFALGRYLFSRAEWDALGASRAGWRELWGDVLCERSSRLQLVLAERVGPVSSSIPAALSR